MAFTVNAERASLACPMNVRMADCGEVLTGAEGRSAWERVSHELRKPAEGSAVVLDFADVRAVTVPFVEEFLVRMLSDWISGYYQDLPLLITNAPEDVRRTIDVTLAGRKLAILSTGEGQPSLLGGDQTLKQTTGSVAQLDEEFTASQLATELHLTLPAANNRLRSLMRSGVVARIQGAPSRGGREYRYRFAGHH